MKKGLIIIFALLLLMWSSINQADLVKQQPLQTQKAPPTPDFPEWYHEKYGDTLAFYDFEDGQIPPGWEIGDLTSGSHLQRTTLNAYGGSGKSYYWGFIDTFAIDPEDTLWGYGYGNLWEDWLETPPIPIAYPDTTDWCLSFMHKFNTESETDPIWDGHSVWIFIPQNDEFKQIHPLETDAYYDSLRANELHCWGNSPGWTGERDWMQATFIDTTMVLIPGDTIYFCILFTSDHLSSYDDGYEGVWIDNILVSRVGPGATLFFDDAGDTRPAQMIFTGSLRGEHWEVTSDNDPLKPPPGGYDPGNFSLLGPEDNTCLSYYITTPWFHIPEDGYTYASFYRMVDMPGHDPEDDNIPNDLVQVEIRTVPCVGLRPGPFSYLFSMDGSGDNDSTFKRVDWNTHRDLMFHEYRGQDIQLRFKVHADHTQETGPGCDRDPCIGRGFFLDDFGVYWMDVPVNDIGMAYINVPYPVSAGDTTEVHIGIANLGSQDIPSAVTFYEICEADTNWMNETIEVGEPLPGYPKPCLTPQGYPPVAAQDTVDFVFQWVPQDPAAYYWRALYFLVDEVPENDSLTVPTPIRVCPEGTGEISYVDRMATSLEPHGFTESNGPAVRFDFDDFGSWPESLRVSLIRHGWIGVWSPYEVYIYGEGPNDSTFGELLFGPILFGDDEPEPEFHVTAVINVADEMLPYVTGSVWIHFRALPSTNLQIPQRGFPTVNLRNWLYYQGDLVRSTKAWDVYLGVDWRPEGCVHERGDANEDGSVNVLDILAVANHILGLHYLTGDGLCTGDCNGDGVINILDALGIANKILGISDCPPTTCKPIVTPETMELMKSLRSHLAAEDFIELMALVKEVQIPVEYSLAQNYPNPFNPITSIQYSVAGNVHTSLKVYNILGQEVVTLVDEVKEPGYYIVKWHGRNEKGDEVSSGVYFYRLTAGTFTATKCMLFLK